MTNYLGNPDEYVEKCPPLGVCTWCGHELCQCFFEGKKGPAAQI